MPEVEVEPEKAKVAWGGAGMSPWGLVPSSEMTPVSLADVMSEELADQLQKKEYKHVDEVVEASGACGKDVPDIPPDVDFDTSDDAMIAQMLQKQFDREYDLALSKEERSLNRNSKVTVTYSKYKMIPDELRCYDSSDEEYDEDYFAEDKRDLDIFETKEKEVGEMPKSGFKKIGDKVVTKHDKELSQRENAKRIMEFPPGIETGDGGSFDMQVSNKVVIKD